MKEKFTLESSRCILLPFEVDDLDLFFSLNTDAFVRKHLWDDQLISRAQAEELLELNQKHFEEKGFGLWKILRKSDEELIGYAGLWYFFKEAQPQLVYALWEKFTGEGYATEAAQVIVDFSFHRLRFEYLLAAMDLDHKASQGVVKRLEFSFIEDKKANGKMTCFFRKDNQDLLQEIRSNQDLLHHYKREVSQGLDTHQLGRKSLLSLLAKDRQKEDYPLLRYLFREELALRGEPDLDPQTYDSLPFELSAYLLSLHRNPDDFWKFVEARYSPSIKGESFDDEYLLSLGREKIYSLMRKTDNPLQFKAAKIIGKRPEEAPFSEKDIEEWRDRKEKILGLSAD